ncbi:methyl-accepting chemotaxis protein [Caulobacter sp. ErkDOM-E]|uniref:methyl-accepting chemotaxis protein n=1 Tax=Caulobacter sp. ErkDOM-E TaxID=3402778 RepID=UPI003AF73E14
MAQPLQKVRGGVAGSNLPEDRVAEWRGLLGRLTNQGARLRFFPHRAVMFLALAGAREGAARSSLIDRAQATLDDFDALVRGFTTDPSVFGIEQTLFAHLSQFLTPHASVFDETAGRFSRECAQVVHAMRMGVGDDEALYTLSEFVAVTLLERMNALVEQFTVELSRVSEEGNARLTGWLSDLDRLNNSVYMISVNAAIQAARSGESGRGFAVIANEVNTVSGQVKSITSTIRRNLFGG